MQDYRVELDAYSGPLDLLLYLVKRDEIDLLNIPIARLTEQYLTYLKGIKDVDVNLAGEFLVMAATLLEIKSAMLVPRGEEAQEEGGGTPGVGESFDPRHELVRQLLAYKRFKDAATDLDDRREHWAARYPRRPAMAKPARDSRDEQIALLEGQYPGEGGFEADEYDNAAAADLDLEDVHVLDLAEAYARVLESIGQGAAQHQIVYDDTPIGLHAEDILDRLAREGHVTLQGLFEGRSRSEAIGLFLATLELTRQRKIRVRQDPHGGSISIEKRDDEASTSAVTDVMARWKDESGQVQYDWPTEEARLAAERRARLRAKRVAERFKKEGEAAPEGEAVEEEIVDLDGEAGGEEKEEE